MTDQPLERTPEGELAGGEAYSLHSEMGNIQFVRTFFISSAPSGCLSLSWHFSLDSAVLTLMLIDPCRVLSGGGHSQLYIKLLQDIGISYLISQKFIYIFKIQWPR